MRISLQSKAIASLESGQRGRTWADITNHLQGQAAFLFQLQIHPSLVPWEKYGMWGLKSPHEDTLCSWLNSGGQGTRVGLSEHVSW